MRTPHPTPATTTTLCDLAIAVIFALASLPTNARTAHTASGRARPHCNRRWLPCQMGADGGGCVQAVARGSWVSLRAMDLRARLTAVGTSARRARGCCQGLLVPGERAILFLRPAGRARGSAAAFVRPPGGAMEGDRHPGTEVPGNGRQPSGLGGAPLESSPRAAAGRGDGLTGQVQCRAPRHSCCRTRARSWACQRPGGSAA